MKTIKKLLFFLFCVSMFSSCVTSKQTDLLQDIKLNYPSLTVKPEEYRIIPGDQLSIAIYTWDPLMSRKFSGYTPGYTYQGLNESTGVNVGEQSRGLENMRGIKPVSVYADGTITFPYLGKIYVQGLTMLEVRDLITQKLDELQDGAATAEVSLANRYFSILGEAGANRITMPNTSMTILQALAIAGNIGPYGDRTKVTLIRQTNTGSISKTFDIRSKEIVDSEFYYIQPNDVIYIPQTSKKFLGSTTSIAGVLGLALSVASLIVVVLRIF